MQVAIVRVVLCVAAFLISHIVYAQTDSISGVVNRYTRVLLIDSCNSALVVEDPRGFVVGDKVMIIQMKGAQIATAADSSFGTITNYGHAGNYELTTLDAVDGRTFVLRHKLARSYALSGIVQIVRIPVYTNVVIKGTVTAQPWNGTTGGVVALCATGNVTLQANIDVRGDGFTGGMEGVVTNWHSAEDYYYPEATDSAGFKGEGITIPQNWYLAGRGKLSNGGGGGNAAASGGAGGGNLGAGGKGGKQSDGFDTLDIGGIGGSALSYSNSVNKIFLGGGGGASGPEHAFYPTLGERGGGIVLIEADRIRCSSDTIHAGGNDNLNNGISGGGGGAGGVVLLKVNHIDSVLAVSVRGGKGGKAGPSVGCYGPGGGGGGGCVWISLGSVPAMLQTDSAGGSSGLVEQANSSVPCHGLPHGAEAGNNGSVITGLQIPEGTVPR